MASYQISEETAIITKCMATLKSNELFKTLPFTKSISLSNKSSISEDVKRVVLE
jgi:hypothetical protein